MKLLLVISLFSLLLFACVSQKYTADTFPAIQIHFGEGGGITGAVNEFCLLQNGQIFVKKNFNKNYKPYKGVKKETAKKCFKTCNKIAIEQIKLDNPGDKYFFISYQTKEIEHKITWGGNNKKEVPAEIIEFYRSLKLLITE